MCGIKRIISTLLLSLLIISCSILQKDDPRKDVQTFLTSFQNDLTKTDDEVLRYFRVNQSREALLSVINTLRNTDPFIICNAVFSSANIIVEKELIKVEIPSNFSVKKLSSDDVESSTLVMWLTPTKDSFLITTLEGEEFYKKFTRIKNMNEWNAAEHLELKERETIYRIATEIQRTHDYDSVIWYSMYNNQNYFYVVDGSWTNYFLDRSASNNPNYGTKMGVVNDKGEIIVPIDFDLVGTIGFMEDDIVEVIKDGKVGYVNIKTGEIVLDPIYDLIMPYDNVISLVKQDSIYGWIDKQHEYHSGFPHDRAERWILEMEFLKRPIQLSPDLYSFCEIPSKDYIGNGIIVPPTYLSKFGIFETIEFGISTTGMPLNGWSEYKVAKGSIFEVITNNIKAVVVMFQERYLEGREEFYDYNNLLFVNNKLDTLGLAVVSGGEIRINPIDSTLLEIQTPFNYWFGEYEASDEINLYEHTYFSISKDNKVTKLKSNRIYQQTQFIKLDSSYLVGEFFVYDNRSEEKIKTTFLSLNTLTYMRDEILASYGFQFSDNERVEQFKSAGKWYQPIYVNIESFEEEMTEIDKYNLAFLNKIIDLIQNRAA